MSQMTGRRTLRSCDRELKDANAIEVRQIELAHSTATVLIEALAQSLPWKLRSSKRISARGRSRHSCSSVFNTESVIEL